MTIHVLSDYQINELRALFRFEDVRKIGFIPATGDIILEYGYVGPFPKLQVSIETIKIPRDAVAKNKGL